MKSLSIKMLPVVAALLLTGCVNLAPNYEQPAAPVPEAWTKDAVAADQLQHVASLPTWDNFYQDARLKQVIQLALDNNRDAKIAALNVQKLEALYGISRAALMPTVAMSGNGTHNRSSARMSPVQQAQVSHVYSAQLASLSYELDFFGRVRNLSEQALQNYLATKEGQTVFENSLIAQVASLWIQIAADQELLATQKALLESQKKSLAMVEDSFKAGATTELAVEQARSVLQSIEADVHASTRQFMTDKTALNLLCGTQVPEELLANVIDDQAIGQSQMLEGAPSEVLLTRPDIRAAENALRAANANIGVARAAFFPRVNLVASVGTMNTSLGDLFDPRTGVWSFVPSVSLPIFTGGINIANLKAANVDQQIAVAKYEKAIQSAFKETMDALVSLTTAENEYKARQMLAQTNRRAYDLSQIRYDNGASSYSDVLTSQTAYIRSLQGAIAAKVGAIAAHINLYKALGGGVVRK